MRGLARQNCELRCCLCVCVCVCVTYLCVAGVLRVHLCCFNDLCTRCHKAVAKVTVQTHTHTHTQTHTHTPSMLWRLTDYNASAKSRRRVHHMAAAVCVCVCVCVCNAPVYIHLVCLASSIECGHHVLRCGLGLSWGHGKRFL